MNALKLNKSDYKIIVGYLVVATIWLAIKFYFENYTLVEYLIDIPVFWLHTIVLLSISKLLINNFLLKKKKYVLLAITALASLWVFGFLASVSGELTRSGIIDWGELPSFIELIFVNINSSAANLAIPLVLISAKKYYEAQVQAIVFSNTQKELELKLLRSQFNPHFLYNSLNTIDALIDYSPKVKVKEYISNLASLYRYLIKINDEDVVPIEDEILLAKNYIYLIKTRFENDYHFTIKNEHTTQDSFLPSGALLTALENIVKHNEPGIHTTIFTTILVESKHIKITNTAAKKEKVHESFGTGLKGLRKRYLLLSNKTIEIRKTETEFVVTLPLLTVLT